MIALVFGGAAALLWHLSDAIDFVGYRVLGALARIVNRAGHAVNTAGGVLGEWIERRR
jgi:hypothetical protein